MDASLMRGEGWVRCTICGELHEHPYPNLAVDERGIVWDVCSGNCAIEAGLREAVQTRNEFLKQEGIYDDHDG